MKKHGYFRLDNSAIMYQMVTTDNAQSLFRLGVVMNEPINKDFLKVAVNKALIRYPIFKSEIKNGFFRPYLIENNRDIVIEEDKGAVLGIIFFKHNHRYLFRVTYYENKIFIDFFHSLCDGTGGIEFLKTICYYYLDALGCPINSANIRIIGDNKLINEEIEDAFDKYYKPISIKEGTKSMLSGLAYPLRGDTFEAFGLGLISMTVDTDKLLAAARSMHCTITEFIASLYILSILKKYENAKPIRKNIIAFIPINMRKIYKSDSLGNFSLFARVSVPYDIHKDLPSIIKAFRESFSKQKEPELLQKQLSFTSFLSKNKILRFVPLIFKSIISTLSKNFRTSTVQTFVLSNLGNVNIENNSSIKGFFFNSNANRKTPCNLGIISYNNKTCISFTRKLISNELERIFFFQLKNFINDIEVESNFREEDNAL